MKVLATFYLFSVIALVLSVDFSAPFFVSAFAIQTTLLPRLLVLFVHNSSTLRRLIPCRIPLTRNTCHRVFRVLRRLRSLLRTTLLTIKRVGLNRITDSRRPKVRTRANRGRFRLLKNNILHFIRSSGTIIRDTPSRVNRQDSLSIPPFRMPLMNLHPRRVGRHVMRQSRVKVRLTLRVTKRRTRLLPYLRHKANRSSTNRLFNTGDLRHRDRHRVNLTNTYQAGTRNRYVNNGNLRVNLLARDFQLSKFSFNNSARIIAHRLLGDPVTPLIRRRRRVPRILLVRLLTLTRRIRRAIRHLNNANRTINVATSFGIHIPNRRNSAVNLLCRLHINVVTAGRKRRVLSALRLCGVLYRTLSGRPGPRWFSVLCRWGFSLSFIGVRGV